MKNSTLLQSQLQNLRLPWNDTTVKSSGELHHFINDQLSSFQYYLPASITLFSDLEIEQEEINKFLYQLPLYLEQEFSLRNARSEQFVNLKLFDEKEIHSILTDYRNVQPWALYFSKEGGLGTFEDNIVAPENSAWGVIPCSFMPNHGVAWRRQSTNNHQIWLATSRQHSKDWDWDSDIGHESAHAGFAPVPLFAQALHLNPATTSLQDVNTIQDLTANHLARMIYSCSEIAVISIRGEYRATQTGLPALEQPEELYAFFDLLDQLMPNMGFSQALEVCQQVGGKFDVKNGTEIFEASAPIIRFLPYISKFIHNFSISTTDFCKCT